MENSKASLALKVAQSKIGSGAANLQPTEWWWGADGRRVANTSGSKLTNYLNVRDDSSLFLNFKWDKIRPAKWG